jgi:hypothetical protein
MLLAGSLVVSYTRTRFGDKLELLLELELKLELELLLDGHSTHWPSMTHPQP